MQIAPGWADHAFVAVLLGLVFPLGGWWSYRRFLRRVKGPGDGPLVREYRETLVWLIGLLLATLCVWTIAGRPLAGLFARRAWEDGELPVTGIITGIAIAVLARPIAIGLSRTLADKFLAGIGDLAPFLPRTKRALAWGIAVSLAAGICEEIAYRGYLMPYLEAYFPLAGAIAVSAVLFGLAHIYQGALGTLATTIMGATFAGMYLATGSLWPAIAMHALIDISAMLTGYLAWRRREEGREPAA